MTIFSEISDWPKKTKFSICEILSEGEGVRTTATTKECVQKSCGIHVKMGTKLLLQIFLLSLDMWCLKVLFEI